MSEKDNRLELIEDALAEDIGSGDMTTLATVDNEKEGKAKVIAKQTGTISGIDYAIHTFKVIDDDLQFLNKYNNGDLIDFNSIVLNIEGRISSILMAERTALNVLGHLSGISTLTAKYAEQLKGTKAKVTDTRKTTPLWREFEKEAVRFGGGVNHRMGLYDMILIKENHIEAAGSIKNAVDRCKKYNSDKNLKCKIEVETTNLAQVKEALACKADQIMLDNMSLTDMRNAVALVDGAAILEASGGVTLDNIRSIAEVGVDLISVGALTHSAPVFDFSLILQDS